MSMIRKFALLFLLIPTFAIQAAETPAPTLFNVTTYTIHPATEPIFEQLVMRYKAAAMKLDRGTTWFAYSPGIGNDLMYTFATPVESFGMFADLSDDVAEAFGAEEAMKMAEMARKSIANIESSVFIQRPDLGIAGPEMTGPPEITFGYTIVVKNGMGPAWEAAMANVIAASKETAPDTYWTTFQGGIAASNEYGIRVNLKWTDLDSPVMSVPARLKKAFGDRKGAKMWQQNLDAVESMETSVERFRADLSLLPAN